MTGTTQVAKTDEEFLREAADRLRARMNRTAQDIVEIGRELIAVRERIDEGRFAAWIEAEFKMSRATAYRFIHVAENMGAHASCLSPETRFGFGVLYELASPSTPKKFVPRSPCASPLARRSPSLMFARSRSQRGRSPRPK